MRALRYNPNMRISSRTPLEPPPWQRSFAALAAKTAENSEKTAGAALFFRPANPRRPSISASYGIPNTDNLLQKQRKQRKRASRKLGRRRHAPQPLASGKNSGCPSIL